MRCVFQVVLKTVLSLFLIELFKKMDSLKGLAGGLGMSETQAVLVAQSKCKQLSLSSVGAVFGTPSYFSLLKFLSWKMHGTAFPSAKPSCIYHTRCHEDLCVNTWRALVLSEQQRTRMALTARRKKCTIDKLCIGIHFHPKLFPEHSCLPALLLSGTRNSLVVFNLDWRNWDFFFYGPGSRDLLSNPKV